jgi:hypothetical protein
VHCRMPLAAGRACVAALVLALARGPCSSAAIPEGPPESLSRSEVMILTVNETCDRPCMEAMRASLLPPRGDCTEATILEWINFITATCPREDDDAVAAQSVLFRMPTIEMWRRNEAGRYRDAPTAPTKRCDPARRRLRGLEANRPYNWGLDRIDQASDTY